MRELASDNWRKTVIGVRARYVYDGQNLIAEKDGSNDLQTSYTIGKGEGTPRKCGVRNSGDGVNEGPRTLNREP